MINRLIITIAIILVGFQDLSGQEKDEDLNRNGLSIFVGGVTNSESSAFALGIDYQYRISKIVGVGLVMDYSFGDIESLLLAPAVFLHVSALEFVVAPGMELSNDDISGIIRLGVSYEFELTERLTLSPSLLYDTERNLEESIVYGLAIGIKL